MEPDGVFDGVYLSKKAFNGLPAKYRIYIAHFLLKVLTMKQEILNFSLRPATNDDIEFIFELRLKTMKPYFENTYGWNDTEERQKAADELNNAMIIIIDKKEIGIIKVIPKTNELQLHQMQILPEFQGKGLGAELIRQTILRSEKIQLPIIIFVITSSPAKRLYERFGFVIIEEFEHHCKMCWQPVLSK